MSKQNGWYNLYAFRDGGWRHEGTCSTLKDALFNFKNMCDAWERVRIEFVKS